MADLNLTFDEMWEIILACENDKNLLSSILPITKAEKNKRRFLSRYSNG
ncbi:hypothetical protein B4102_0185 [Heyndrickxia sporothermodurans]|uniref:Uncharacterized protein n=1 Tax=Heyndrickxia sporothermodurans TaxID=46224 RepID=A0A150LGZ5_9BACI|nr:hypothetical protein B4102_0185 [Heyndrickxia sporothermodurans]